ncbi:MAG: beta-hydroxyacyl-ACP dehydratase [Oscillospiraceae bacterium]|nr:beta-hydroxyacyl-ACP dehydratase [Oscillospiraceae bacterium]
MKRDELKKILPHREPMLLLDEAELDGEVSIGRYTVRGDEFFLQGHFPENPVVPGVILCEMLAQSSCLLVNMEGENKTPYFTGLTNVKFKGMVKPGDTIEFRTTKTNQKGPFYFMKGEGKVNGKLCIKGELSFALA